MLMSRSCASFFRGARFVNANYGGCSVDAGWMVLDDETSDPCDWETNNNNGDTGSIDILYSPKTTYSNAEDYWLQADAFAVLVDIDQASPTMGGETSVSSLRIYFGSFCSKPPLDTLDGVAVFGLLGVPQLH